MKALILALLLFSGTANAAWLFEFQRDGSYRQLPDIDTSEIPGIIPACFKSSAEPVEVLCLMFTPDGKVYVIGAKKKGVVT